MKKLLSLVLLAGMLAAPVYAETEAMAKVTAMAKADSGATMDALSMAVYECVKAEPSQAVAVFKGVIDQRASWSATETYAILRAVLLANPSLESGFVQSAESYANGVTGSDDAALLVAALYETESTQSVAAAVVQGVAGSSSVARAASGNGVSSAVLEAYVPAAPVVPEFEVPSTPLPTSPNN